jgi:hypothetical protein
MGMVSSDKVTAIYQNPSGWFIYCSAADQPPTASFQIDPLKCYIVAMLSILYVHLPGCQTKFSSVASTFNFMKTLSFSLQDFVYSELKR